MSTVKQEKPKYVTIKRVVKTEEEHTIKECSITMSALDAGLRSGDLNLIQSATVEPRINVVDKNGKRVAILEKDGGTGPDHEVEVKVW